jgi:hypothetical protein
MRGLLAVAIASSILLAGCSLGADQKEPALKIDGALRNPPSPQDASLRLKTSDVKGCSGADHEVVDVSVEETEAEIVIEAGLEVGEELLCEIRSVQEDFTVELDRPLGRRLVIDSSRGERSVIWSPQMRRAVLHRLQVNTSDALAFILSKFPGGEDVRCITYGPVLFSCSLRAPSREKRLIIYVEVRAGAEDLNAMPERPLSPDLRQALMHDRR